MKKTILILLVVMLTGAMAQAQFSAGPKIGFNISKLALDYVDKDYQPDTKFKMSYQIGGVAKYDIGKSFAVRLGVMFVNKGTAYNSFPYRDSITGQVTGEVDITKGYMRDEIYNFEFPLDFVLNISLGKDDDLIFHAGPYYAIALGGKRKWEYDYTVAYNDGTSETGQVHGDKKIKTKNAVGDEELAEDVNYIRSTDYGLNFGLGYRLYSFEYNIQYGYGLSNIFTDYSGSDPQYADFNRNDWKQSHRVITFGITYFISK